MVDDRDWDLEEDAAIVFDVAHEDGYHCVAAVLVVHRTLLKEDVYLSRKV